MTAVPVLSADGDRLLVAALLLLHAVDTAGGQGGAVGESFIWEGEIERRPLITWDDIARLRAGVAARIEERMRATTRMERFECPDLA